MAAVKPKNNEPGPLIPGAKVLNAGKTTAKVDAPKSAPKAAPKPKVDPKTQAARDRIKELDKKAEAPKPAQEELPWDAQVAPGAVAAVTAAEQAIERQEVPAAPAKAKRGRKPKDPSAPKPVAATVEDKLSAVLKAKSNLIADQAREIASLKKELAAERDAKKDILKKVAALGVAKVRKPRKAKAEKV